MEKCYSLMRRLNDGTFDIYEVNLTVPFSAIRKEFKRIEIFFLICSFVLLLGAYNNSVTIRLGDKYDIWSKLEATQPRSIFGIKRRSINKT